jgi:malonyl-CoA O-methyltransferase
MSLPPKQRIRDAFNRAATTYHSAAKVQRRVCLLLADGLSPVFSPAVILDAGCGTGYGLHLLALRFPASRRLALDFAPAMLAQARPFEFGAAGDIEHLPLASGSISLYWSSLTIQWCHLPQVCLEAGRVLRQGGHLALSTLGPGTFCELREAFAGIDQHRHTLGFQTEAELRRELEHAGFHDIHIRRHHLIAHYPDLKSLLGAVKAVGANQVGGERRSGLMGRHSWAQLEAAYEHRRTPRGLPLSYDVLLCHAKK